MIIPSVSQLVKTYCGNSFIDYVSTLKEEIFNVPYDTQSIILGEYPVIEVISVEERDNAREPYITLESSDYVLDVRSDSLVKNSGYWAKGTGSVKVNYNAGYTELPLELRLAVIDLVHFYMKDEYKESRSLGTGSMKNVIVSSLGGNIGFPDHIKRVLDMYRQA